jgi:hypothetical protein
MEGTSQESLLCVFDGTNVARRLLLSHRNRKGKRRESARRRELNEEESI